MTNLNGKVQILLSTYNGENFVEQLLESLLKQDYPSYNIKIRDDGSTDNTINILNKLKSDKIAIDYGENIGVINSFFKLLKDSDKDCDYFAFCDQDDFWLNDKITRAINILSSYDNEKPLLYCSNLILVDENLKIIKEKALKNIKPAFGNSLVENVATGCTIVINNAAKRCLIEKLPKKIIIHDWWIYQVISAFGEVIFDNESRIYYRLHSSNTIGLKTSVISKWKARIKKFIAEYNKNLISQQARELFYLYAYKMDEDKKDILKCFINQNLSLFDRFKIVISFKIFRQNKLDNFIIRVLFIFNML